MQNVEKAVKGAQVEEHDAVTQLHITSSVQLHQLCSDFHTSFGES